MILYNHPSYFKSGEIKSCRLSPLPTLRATIYKIFTSTFYVVLVNNAISIFSYFFKNHLSVKWFIHRSPCGLFMFLLSWIILKGHWTTSASSPICFQKRIEILIPLEVNIYVVTACSILLANSTHLQRNMHFSFLSYLLKSTLKNGCHCHNFWIWHHPSFSVVCWKIPKSAFYSSLYRWKIYWNLYKEGHFCFK